MAPSLSLGNSRCFGDKSQLPDMDLSTAEALEHLDQHPCPSCSRQMSVEDRFDVAEGTAGDNNPVARVQLRRDPSLQPDYSFLDGENQFIRERAGLIAVSHHMQDTVSVAGKMKPPLLRVEPAKEIAGEEGLRLHGDA